MAYSFKEVTIRTKNTKDGIKAIEELWGDIISKKIPILYDNNQKFIQGISPVSRYSNYESDENGYYDFSIIAVNSDFFVKLEEDVQKGLYEKYDISDDNNDIDKCTKIAWKKVWEDTQTGKLQRAFKVDYESTVPAEFAGDGKLHCYLYISKK